MSHQDAYRNEMNLLRQHDIDDPEFTSLAREIRSALVRGPDPSTEARHISAIVEQARRAPSAPTAPPAQRKSSPPRRLAAKLGAAAAALGLVTGGLALAGVDVPLLSNDASEPAPRAVVDDAGNGEHGRSETSQRVQASIDVNLPLLQTGDISGCEFGALVSAAARDVAPDSTHCKGEPAGKFEAAPATTAARVRATVDANIPLLHAGDISGCEFGALVSAAARDVAPDSSHCSTDTAEGDTTSGSSGSGHAGNPSEKTKATGKDKGEGPSDGEATRGNKSKDTKTTGQDKAEEASGGKANGGNKSKDTKTTGQDKAEEASGGKANGGGNGAQQSAEGKQKEEATASGGKAEEASGGQANPGGKSDKD